MIKIKLGDISAEGLLTYRAQKTGKTSTIKLKNSTAAALRRSADEGSTWCFPSPIRRGQHITRQAVWQRCKRAAARAGVELAGCSPHSLRKAFAVELYARAGLAAVREALQHSRDDVTSLYALSDYTTGDNALRPLLRADIPLICEIIKRLLMDKSCSSDE